MINQAPTITGKHVVLRAPCETDIEERLKIGRSTEYIRMCGGDTRNLPLFTRDDALRWYEFITSNRFEWVIETEGRCIGTARLTVLDKDYRARYAIGIHDTSKYNKGFGTEVTELILDFAFNNLHLHRVDLKVLEYNKRAISCYEKCGFTKEGVEREGALIEDEWENDVMMSILEQEYRKRKQGVTESI